MATYQVTTNKEKQPFRVRASQILGSKMNKADLINDVSASTGVSKQTATAVIEAMMGSIVRAIAKGEKVTLVNFATFTPVTRAARIGRNPATGDAVNIPAKQDIKFKAGKLFIDGLNA